MYIILILLFYVYLNRPIQHFMFSRFRTILKIKQITINSILACDVHELYVREINASVSVYVLLTSTSVSFYTNQGVRITMHL